jgi:hypothetical protein
VERREDGAKRVAKLREKALGIVLAANWRIAEQTRDQERGDGASWGVLGSATRSGEQVGAISGTESRREELGQVRWKEDEAGGGLDGSESTDRRAASREWKQAAKAQGWVSLGLPRSCWY